MPTPLNSARHVSPGLADYPARPQPCHADWPALVDTARSGPAPTSHPAPAPPVPTARPSPSLAAPTGHAAPAPPVPTTQTGPARPPALSRRLTMPSPVNPTHTDWSRRPGSARPDAALATPTCLADPFQLSPYHADEPRHLAHTDYSAPPSSPPSDNPTRSRSGRPVPTTQHEPCPPRPRRLPVSAHARPH